MKMTTDEKWLTREMRRRFKLIKLRSFEACRIADVPDLYAVTKFEYGVEHFWIEAKAMPKVDSPIPYSGGQLKWIRELEGDGGKVFLVCLLTATRHAAVILPSPRETLAVIDLVNPLWSEALENILRKSL